MSREADTSFPFDASVLIGAWELRHWIEAATQTPPEALGPSPRGQLIYTANGYVCVSMMRTAPGPGVSYMGYSGRWEFVGPNTVIHRIDICSRPDWVGAEQIREIELEAGTLAVTANGSTLIWHRLADTRSPPPNMHGRA